MRRMISTKAEKAAKKLAEVTAFNEETNTLEIGTNVEIDGKLILNTTVHFELSDTDITRDFLVANKLYLLNIRTNYEIAAFINSHIKVIKNAYLRIKDGEDGFDYFINACSINNEDLLKFITTDAYCGPDGYPFDEVHLYFEI